MGKLFGTDGIRGIANQYPITCDVALKTGQAVGLLCRKNDFNHVVIGKDTRLSGDMLEAALSAGVCSTGVTVLSAGIIPTPGVAFLCQDIESAGAGIVISASHNPYQDNGIKIFKQGGIKLSDEEEKFVEDYILGTDEGPSEAVGRIQPLPDSLDRYAGFLLSKFPFRKLSNKLKLVVDCSNGAASKIGHQVFNQQLFDAVFIHDTPDGKNINHGCGSQHTDDLRALVVKNNADLGLAFDGDADRLIAVDDRGNEITGDRILAICSAFAKEKGRLKNNILVSTIMSNIGLGHAMDKLGIIHLKSGVGDRLVLELMKEKGAVIGGEDSGHMIYLDDHSTGDGLLSALKLIEVIIEKNKPVSELAEVMTVYPQVLMNVTVDGSRPDYTKNETIVNTIRLVEAELGASGRVLVRYSGTQPMVRVMVEGPDQERINELCSQICESIKNNL